MQSASPPCPAGRPVDDFITEIHKQQSKKKHRNLNPLPDSICLWGWCRDRSKQETPPTVPETPPQPEKQAESDGTSSSKVPIDPCREAMEKALEAAHNVEVGDFYFADKSYNPALFRYKDADQEKPGDAAIHVRLGRVFEKLNQIPEAIQEYNAAQKLATQGKWSDEAKAALTRLDHRPGS